MKRDRFEVFKGDDGLWFWRFRSKNGKIMSIAGEGFTTKGSARRSILKTQERQRMALASLDGIIFSE